MLPVNQTPQTALDLVQTPVGTCRDLQGGGLRDPRTWVVKDPSALYRVTDWRSGGKRPNLDKSTVVYNASITMTDVPLEACDYVVNGKPALEWGMERQVVKTDKASGIVNDANEYANETMRKPAYPLELFQRVITVMAGNLDGQRDLAVALRALTLDNAVPMATRRDPRLPGFARPHGADALHPSVTEPLSDEAEDIALPAHPPVALGPDRTDRQPRAHRP